MYYLDVSVSGYLSEVSPIKVSKDKKRRYFNLSIQNDNTLHRGVCFSWEKHRLFNNINVSSHSGIEIKCFGSSDNNNDIIVNHFSSVKKTDLNFERKTLQSKCFTIEQVINECAIYDIVDVTGLVYNLQTEAEHEKDGKPLRIRKGMIKDETGSIGIVLFSSLVDEVSNNTSYDFKKMKVQKFMNNRILKSTEITKVSKNDDVAIFVTDEDLSAFSYEKSVKAKVFFIDLKTVAQTYLFSVCSVPVSINNAVAWYEKCDNASSQSQCKSKADVKMVILNDSGQLRSTIDVPRALTKKSINLTVSNTPKKDIVMKLINRSFIFTLNKTNRCSDTCYWTDLQILFPSNLSILINFYST